jgi:hypothetical protein
LTVYVRRFGAGTLCAVAACGLFERVDVEPDAQPDPPAAVLAEHHHEAPEAAPAAPERDWGLGAAVADLVPEPLVATGTLGGDLSLVEGIELTNVTAGWTDAPKSTMRHLPIVFEVLADVEVGPDIGINGASLVAKATCQYEDERRASSSILYQPSPSGMASITAEAGAHKEAWAHLFPYQDIVGHTPCQIEFRLVSPLSDKPMRVAGVWCATDDATTEGACEGLARPTRREGESWVSDLSFDKWRRVANATIELQDRVWLDRDLFLRTTCDDGGERVPRMVQATASWGHLDPGDAVSVQFQNYYGWFAAAPPCEVTFEWWRRTDTGHHAEPIRAATMCVRKFLPEEGACWDDAGASTIGPALTLRRFDPSIVRDPYDRSYARLTAELDVLANEDIDGRWDIEIKGSCGTGRRKSAIYMSRPVTTEPGMLRRGEASVGTYTAWLGRSVSSCEVSVELAPRTSSGETATALVTYCVDRSGAKPC